MLSSRPHTAPVVVSFCSSLNSRLSHRIVFRNINRFTFYVCFRGFQYLPAHVRPANPHFFWCRICTTHKSFVMFSGKKTLRYTSKLISVDPSPHVSMVEHTCTEMEMASTAGNFAERRRKTVVPAEKRNGDPTSRLRVPRHSRWDPRYCFSFACNLLVLCLL